MASVRLLLVDDDPQTLLALPDLLQARLYRIEIETVSCPRAALERINSTDYEVIVSDVQMPGMDGLMLMERVRAIRPHTPTLLMSGQIGEDIVRQALNAGAYAFLSKPLDGTTLVAAIKRALQARHLHRQLEEQKWLLMQYAAELKAVRGEMSRLEARLRGMTGDVEDREEDSQIILPY